jgi:putative nucleotidyltransferase with HDIG domain
MITVELLKECRLEFEEYFQSLITDSPDSLSRIEDIRTHSLRVANNSLLLAQILLPNEEDRRVAEVIALFHDYGKAVLIAQGTESPINIQHNHAALSAKLVQQMDFYPKLPTEVQLIVLKSIENHNKLRLPKLDNEQQTLFARLLRDADKLDIYETSYRFFKEKNGLQPMMTLDLINHVEVSEKIVKSIMAGKTAAVEDMKTMNDYRLLLLSMAFDLNFKYTFRILAEKQFIQKIYETLPKRDQIIDAYRGIKLFVENKFVS